MAVKRTQSGARLLALVEALAQDQPLGVSDLARRLNEDKSTVQRMLMTLADAGWIRASGMPTQWEMTGRIQMLAHLAGSGNPVFRRARAVLEALRDQTGETTLLAALEDDKLVVIEVAESAQELRMIPRIGQIVPDRVSASALAILAHLPPERQARLLGKAAGAGVLAACDAVTRNGYAAQWSERGGGTMNIAAPVFDRAGRAAAVVVLTAPAFRLPAEQESAIGAKVAAAARDISFG